MTHDPAALACVDGVDLADRTVLVTGSTDGIGREAALALAHLGADLLVHGRDRAKGEAVVDEIARTGGEATFVRADFTDLDAVRDLAATAREHGIDVLVNNAGAHFRRGALTDVGVERTFAVNHLAPFLLTLEVLETLDADGRIVTVASDAHRGTTLDLPAVRSVDDHGGFWAYKHSKLANILFTRRLAAHVEQPATCLHPGFVPGSALWRESPAPVSLAMRTLRLLPDRLVNLLGATPATGAATIVYLAASPAVTDLTGQYLAECASRTPSAAARDDDAAERLWEWSLDVLDREASLAG